MDAARRGERRRALDADKVIKGLMAAGIDEQSATTMAAKLAPAADETDAHAPSLVRTQVREYMLRSVQQLKPLIGRQGDR